MKRIPLTRGMSALVDDGDYRWLSQWKWYAQWATSTRSFYASRHIDAPNGRRTSISMHRSIMGLTYGDGKVVDHKNSQTLDNRRGNLRLATNAQNIQNCRKRFNSRSRYKGVSWSNGRQKWTAQIYIDGKNKWLGYFVDERAAHARYSEEAKVQYGSFARTK